MRDAVEHGELRPGARLPAERDVASVLAVSRGTVVTAFATLRDEGFLESRPGSGNWVRRHPSGPLQLTDLDLIGTASAARRLAGRILQASDDVVDLAVSSPCGLTPELRAVIESGLRDDELSRDGHGLSPIGIAPLRERIAEGFERQGVKTASSQIVVTAGAQQAISLACRLLLEPGDTILVQSPSFPGAIDAAARTGARILTIPPDDSPSTMRLVRDLVAKTDPRFIYLMPACHNPLGFVMPTNQRRQFAALADDRELFIVEDNSLEHLVYEAVPEPAPVARFAHCDRVLSIGSLSKSTWGGLRVGWIRGSLAAASRLGRIKACADLGLSVLTQVSACHAIDHLDALVAAQRRRYEPRLRYAEQLALRLLPDFAFRSPAGGLSLWMRLPGGDADSFAELARRHGVAITPGSVLCIDGSHPEWFRLSTAVPEPTLHLGITRLAAAWKDACARRTARVRVAMPATSSASSTAGPKSAAAPSTK
jgi:DNA-binding transcriptional MocR family regulator